MENIFKCLIEDVDSSLLLVRSLENKIIWL